MAAIILCTSPTGCSTFSSRTAGSLMEVACNINVGSEGGRDNYL